MNIRTRIDLNEGWEEVLEKLNNFLKENKPFMYLRYGDGEFEAMFGASRGNKKNGDNCIYYSDLGLSLLDSLVCIADLKDKSNILVGGNWTDPNHLKELENRGLIDTINWCSASAMGAGIETLKPFEILKLLFASPRKKVLVSNIRISGLAKVFNMEWVGCSLHNNWLEHERIENDIEKFLKDDPLVIYCAGMASEPIAWKMWKLNPNSIQFDMGSIFDPAFGIYERSWVMENKDIRWDNYQTHYIPFLRGERE